ncbi:MAG: hypothetical protein LC624_04585 [Halobacteriales archaeon]|nr:hypothetical protein [Halobacteriales archaeon]
MRLTPVQKDGAVFLGALAVLLAGVWLAVSFGMSFTGATGGAISGWAIAVIALGYIVVAGSVFWWYYVSLDEREPARGEFRLDAERKIHGGEGSFRLKSPGPGVVAEPQYRMAADPSFVPRTLPRWLAWIGLMVIALLGAAALVAFAKTTEDPLSPLMVAVGLLGGAVMLGALGVGEMSHAGPWNRRRVP